MARSLKPGDPSPLLTQIDGDKTGLWATMEDALDDSSLDLVSTRRVMRLAERLELDDDLDDLAVMRLATELELDAIIQGVFDPHTRKLRFTIFVNGKKGKPFSVQASDAGTDGFRKRVHAIMMANLTAAMKADAPVKDGATASDVRRSKKPKAAGKPTVLLARNGTVVAPRARAPRPDRDAGRAVEPGQHRRAQHRIPLPEAPAHSFASRVRAHAWPLRNTIT